MITVFESIRDWQKLRASSNFGFRTLGFVPTMGALHDGHLSLVRRSKEENDRTLVSIFVNPTQFDDSNDFKNYPKTLHEDLKMLEDVGVDYVLLPNEKEIYQDKYRFQVLETEVSQILCGKFRPGHFQGVLTVVLKLLNVADSHRAYFGEKDFQQYLLIREMAEAFFIKTQIVGAPTIREADGLAMSSRNRRLSSEERVLAKEFPRILMESPSTTLATEKLKKLGFSVDYVEEQWGRRLAAIRLGEVRLIDNVKI